MPVAPGCRAQTVAHLVMGPAEKMGAVWELESAHWSALSHELKQRADRQESPTGSRRGYGGVPLGHRPRPEDAQGATGDQMMLKI